MTICAHAWEDTGLTKVAYGTTYQQKHKTHYCPNCRQWGHVPYMYMHGRFNKAIELPALREAERKRVARERAAWLAEHHPNHLAEERP